ncbi:MAG: hypothetical protein R2864_01200 [Syntrophotaleaceae bacterium]
MPVRDSLPTGRRSQELDQLDRRGWNSAGRKRSACRAKNGVTFNSSYDEPSGTSRPWQLDPISFIGSDEWSEIETGLIQRAELLNLIG